MIIRFKSPLTQKMIIEHLSRVSPVTGIRVKAETNNTDETPFSCAAYTVMEQSILFMHFYSLAFVGKVGCPPVSVLDADLGHL